MIFDITLICPHLAERQIPASGTPKGGKKKKEGRKDRQYVGNYVVISGKAHRYAIA